MVSSTIPSEVILRRVDSPVVKGARDRRLLDRNRADSNRFCGFELSIARKIRVVRRAAQSHRSGFPNDRLASSRRDRHRAVSAAARQRLEWARAASSFGIAVESQQEALPVSRKDRARPDGSRINRFWPLPGHHIVQRSSEYACGLPRRDAPLPPGPSHRRLDFEIETGKKLALIEAGSASAPGRRPIGKGRGNPTRRPSRIVCSARLDDVQDGKPGDSAANSVRSK